MRVDRTIHAQNADASLVLVRYDRAGKWYVEPGGSVRGPRRAVTLAEAVDIAIDWWNDGGTPHIGRPGGGMFDARLRRGSRR